VRSSENIYSAVSSEFKGLMETQHQVAANLRQSWPVSLPVVCYCLNSPSPFIKITPLLSLKAE